MNIFKYSLAVADRLRGWKTKSIYQNARPNADPLQDYMTIGQFKVGPKENTPQKKNYNLTVYQDDEGILHQALSELTSPNLTPVYVRKFSPELGYYRAFQSPKTGRRYEVEEYLAGFVDYVRNHTRNSSDVINFSVITDTHYKNLDSVDFYGKTALTHVKEFSYLDKFGLLDLKVHLGDWIDGSDAGLVSEQELIRLREAFASDQVPYLMIKGNHDENDKFDELHDLTASFPEQEFSNIMLTKMYQQNGLHYITKRHGVAFYDVGQVRFISVNTSDLPYVLDSHKQKKYDSKLTLAVREDQIEEIIEILSQSDNRKIVFMSHANPINRKGSNALKYNGRSLHELLVAFNQHEKGRMSSNSGIPAEFHLTNDFDFTKVKHARIIAYLCGHRHHEDEYRINGIQYILFNCSALMGKNHVLTTKYNKNWDREIDKPSEFAGYIVSIDLSRHYLQCFGYGAATKRRIFRIG